MKCVRCGKLIFRPERASTMLSADGPVAWGPKCAVIAGLVRPTKPRKRRAAPKLARSRQSRAVARSGQVDWVDELAATP